MSKPLDNDKLDWCRRIIKSSNSLDYEGFLSDDLVELVREIDCLRAWNEKLEATLRKHCPAIAEKALAAAKEGT